MYCSSCGIAVTDSLSYCNHCGAKIVGAKTEAVIKSAGVKPELLVCAMVATFVLGLIAITIFLGALKSVLGLETAQILGFAAVSFLTMLLLEGVFLLLLFRRNRVVVES